MTKAGAGMDQRARRHVNLSLNEDIVLRARSLTRNLSATVEQLLRDFIQQEQKQRRDADGALDKVISALNLSHAQTGLLSDKFPSL